MQPFLLKNLVDVWEKTMLYSVEILAVLYNVVFLLKRVEKNENKRFLPQGALTYFIPFVGRRPRPYLIQNPVLLLQIVI